MRLPESVGAPLVGALPGYCGVRTVGALPCSPCPSAPLRGTVDKIGFWLPVLPSWTKGPFRGPPRTKGVAVPTWTVLPLPLRGPALRGQKVLPLPFSVPLRGPPWIKRCCRCRSPCPSAALRGQKVLPLPFSVPLRGPPWTKKGVVAGVKVFLGLVHQIGTPTSKRWPRAPCPAPLVGALRRLFWRPN